MELSWLVAWAFCLAVGCCCTAIDIGVIRVVDRDLGCREGVSVLEWSTNLSVGLESLSERKGDTIGGSPIPSRISSFSISRFANCHSISIRLFSSSRFSDSRLCRCWSRCNIAFVSCSNLRIRSWVVALSPAYVLIATSSLLCFVSFDVCDIVEIVSRLPGSMSHESHDDSKLDGALDRCACSWACGLDEYFERFDGVPFMGLAPFALLAVNDRSDLSVGLLVWFLFSCIKTISLTEHCRSFNAILARTDAKASASCLALACVNDSTPRLDRYE